MKLTLKTVMIFILTYIGFLLFIRESSALSGKTRTRVQYTQEELFSFLVDQDKRVSAFCVEYQARGQQEFYNHRMLAAKAPDTCYYFGSKGTNFSSQPKWHIFTDWKNDIFRDWVLVTVDACYSGQPAQRTYTHYPLSNHDPLPHKLMSELIFCVLGWWPFENRPAPQMKDGPVVLRDIVRSGKYKLRPKLEKCNGKYCHVLESNHDVLWLYKEEERPIMVLKREFYEPSSGMLLHRLEMSGHEIQDKISYPTKVISTLFLGDARQQCSYINITNVMLNSKVSDDLFTEKVLLPGTITKMQVDKSFKQIVPGGYDYMDEMANWVKRNVEYEKPVARVSVTEIICYLVTILISLHIIYWCWKSRRASKVAEKSV